LLLSGTPGVGKTLVLDVAAEMAAASGTTVLRGRGIGSEADIAFGVLNQVLLPLALERFQWLHAHPWTSRALDELRATRQTRTRSEPSAAEPLTAREHQIVTLAASGLRNKDIAGQLKA
jgi:ATP/maltotriose-dependent transcriptional regulator MalT